MEEDQRVVYSLISDFKEDPFTIEEKYEENEGEEIIDIKEEPLYRAEFDEVENLKNIQVSSLKIKVEQVPEKIETYECAICWCDFTASVQLRSHLRTHNEFKCECCQKKFTQYVNLMRHIKNRAGEKPFRCKICDKKFSQKSNLKRHNMMVHKRKKPYSCKICKKKFTQYSLRRHMQLHTGEKPFSCNVCFKKFTQRCNLKIHKNIHTGEKPYRCNICHREFIQNSNLKSHTMKTHLGKKLYGYTKGAV